MQRIIALWYSRSTNANIGLFRRKERDLKLIPNARLTRTLGMRIIVFCIAILRVSMASVRRRGASRFPPAHDNDPDGEDNEEGHTSYCTTYDGSYGRRGRGSCDGYNSIGRCCVCLLLSGAGAPGCSSRYGCRPCRTRDDTVDR